MAASRMYRVWLSLRYMEPAVGCTSSSQAELQVIVVADMKGPAG